MTGHHGVAFAPGLRQPGPLRTKLRTVLNDPAWVARLRATQHARVAAAATPAVDGMFAAFDRLEDRIRQCGLQPPDRSPTP